MTEETQTPEVPEVEQQAMEHGWQPEEAFKADPKNSGKKWRPAEEFMDRKSLFDKIEDQHKELRTLKKGIEALTQHNKIIEQTSYERAIKELRAERRKALEDGELTKAEDIKDQIEEIQKTQTQAANQPQQTEHPEFTQFKQNNDWYGKDVKMTAWADGMGALLARQGKSPSEVLADISKTAREEFPEKFSRRNPNKEDAPAVGGGSTKRTSGGDTFKLTDMEQRIMDNLIRAGAKITPEEYKAQLKKSKGL